MQNKTCGICLEHKLDAKETIKNHLSIWTLSCPRCGELNIAQVMGVAIYYCLKSDNASQDVKRYKGAINEDDFKLGDFIDNPPPQLGTKGDKRRAYASAFIRQHGPHISIKALHQISKIKRPTVSERINLLMQELVKDSDDLGRNITISDDDPKWLSVMWCQDWSQAAPIVNYCTEVGWYSGNVTFSGNGLATLGGAVTISGWNAFEFTKKSSRNVFIAMWFDETMNTCAKNIGEAISECDFNPRKVDDIEHVGKIDDRIIHELNNCIAIVADFTGHRGGVYFEAGYALGLGIPVIWTCREDEIKKLHFDIRQYNCISWKDEADLKSRLNYRIKSLEL